MWNFDINHIQVGVESRPAYKLALDWSQWLDPSMIPPESPYSVMIDSCIGLLPSTSDGTTCDLCAVSHTPSGIFGPRYNFGITCNFQVWAPIRQCWNSKEVLVYEKHVDLPKNKQVCTSVHVYSMKPPEFKSCLLRGKYPKLSSLFH